jgi:hypothetical protein
MWAESDGDKDTGGQSLNCDRDTGDQISGEGGLIREESVRQKKSRREKETC